MNDDDYTSVFKDYYTNTIKGITYNSVWIDETGLIDALDENLPQRDARVWVHEIAKRKALDELFGEL